jgi:hypothetical protein
MRSDLALLALLILAARSAAAVDCSPVAVVCVPEESTLENAFLNVPDGGTIDVAAGTYPSPAADNGFRLGSTAAARNRSFTVRARNGAGTVTLTGEGARRIVVLDSLAAGRWITFEGLRFVNGRSATANVAGGVTLKNARATFADCEFVGNSAASGSNGGGALGLYGGATALVLRALFENNRAIPEGGAVFVQKGYAPYDSPSEIWIEASTFRANCETGNLANCTSGNGAGGALLVRNSKAYVADSLFENNAAGWVGGALYGFGEFACSAPYCSTPAADVLITRSRFTGNHADGSNAPGTTEAGAIHVEDCARVRMYQSVLDANFAGWGGAVVSYRAGIEVYESAFHGNRATASGALAAQGGTILAVSGDGTGCVNHSSLDFPAATLRVERSLIEGNSGAAQEAQAGGCVVAKGDIVNTGSGPCQSTQTLRCAQVAMTDSAIFGCDVAKMSTPVFVSGGGFYFDRSYVTVARTLVARNRALGNDGTVCAQGGAGVIANDAAVTLSDTLFSGNTSECQNDNLHILGANPPAETNTRYYTAESTTPTDGFLLGVPPRLAADTPRTAGEAWLAWAFSGTSATLDGAGVGAGSEPNNGLQAAGDALHSLVVSPGSVTRTADVQTAPVPATTLTLGSTCVTGGSTSLSWTTPSGTFLAGMVDQASGGAGASGSVTVAPAGSVTFRRLALTTAGGADAAATLDVGSCPFFSDGFESGDTSAWSSTQG